MPFALIPYDPAVTELPKDNSSAASSSSAPKPPAFPNRDNPQYLWDGKSQAPERLGRKLTDEKDTRLGFWDTTKGRPFLDMDAVVTFINTRLAEAVLPLSDQENETWRQTVGKLATLQATGNPQIRAVSERSESGVGAFRGGWFVIRAVRRAGAGEHGGITGSSGAGFVGDRDGRIVAPRGGAAVRGQHRERRAMEAACRRDR